MIGGALLATPSADRPKGRSTKSRRQPRQRGGLYGVLHRLSLIGVFLPILLMGGIIGRLFREFTMTLSVAVMISLVLSLTATPMMCSILLRREKTLRTNWFSRIAERCFQRMLRFYDTTLRWSLKHSFLILLVLLGSTTLNFYLFNVVPKGFFPQQDAGTLLDGV